MAINSGKMSSGAGLGGLMSMIQAFSGNSSPSDPQNTGSPGSGGSGSAAPGSYPSLGVDYSGFDKFSEGSGNPAIDRAVQAGSQDQIPSGITKGGLSLASDNTGYQVGKNRVIGSGKRTSGLSNIFSIIGDIAKL